MCRPCSITQIHSLTSLTGPGGQQFAFRLGGAALTPGMDPHLQRNWVLLLAMSSYNTVYSIYQSSLATVGIARAGHKF